MYDLTIIKQNGSMYIDSREVAEIIGKDHNHLLRDIRSYANIIDKIGESKNGHSDFFIESTYQSGQNKTMPCYLLSKMGCEMVANKLTGEKGVIFTTQNINVVNASISSIGRRSKKQGLSSQIMIYKDLLILPVHYQVFVKNMEITLTKKRV